MSKKASAIVSSAGFVSGFFTDLVTEVRRAGGTDEDIYRLATPDGKSTFIKVARLIAKKAVKSVAKTFAELLAACRQNWVDHSFTEKHFPLEPVAHDEDSWEVVEHRFDRAMTGEKAFVELRNLGYRLLGGSRRAMEFLAKNPDLQFDHPLVVTARWQDPRGYWCAPFADRFGGEREVRAAADQVLRHATGQEMGFDPDAAPADRAAAIERWREWAQ